MCDYIVPTFFVFCFFKCAKKGLVWAVRAASRTAKKQRQANISTDCLHECLRLFSGRFAVTLTSTCGSMSFTLLEAPTSLQPSDNCFFKLSACICEKYFQFMSGTIPRMSSKDAQKVYITDLECHKGKEFRSLYVLWTTTCNAPFISKVVGHKG